MMREDIECPYCGDWQDINHDDGAGYDEDTIHSQECNNCNKTFAFTTYTVRGYEATKADCLNGGEHNLEQIKGCPRELFVSKFRCVDCGKVIIKDIPAHEKARKKYFNSFDKK